MGQNRTGPVGNSLIDHLLTLWRRFVYWREPKGEYSYEDMALDPRIVAEVEERNALLQGIAPRPCPGTRYRLDPRSDEWLCGFDGEPCSEGCKLSVIKRI